MAVRKKKLSEPLYVHFGGGDLPVLFAQFHDIQDVLLRLHIHGREPGDADGLSLGPYLQVARWTLCQKVVQAVVVDLQHGDLKRRDGAWGILGSVVTPWTAAIDNEIARCDMQVAIHPCIRGEIWCIEFSLKGVKKSNVFCRCVTACHIHDKKLRWTGVRPEFLCLDV